MVNPVNSPRAVPQLGARKDDSQNQIPVQDARKEAARQIERNKRRFEEATPCGAQSGLRTAHSHRLTLLAICADEHAHATASRSMPAPAQVSHGAHEQGPAAPQGGAESVVATGEAAATAPAVGAGTSREQAPLPMQPAEAPVPKQPADAAVPEQEMSGRVRVAGSETTAVVPQPQSQALASPPVPTSQMPKASPTMLMDMHGQPSAAKAMSPAAPTLVAAKGEATVFDVPLRGIGSQQSTQVSLNLTSGQVVLSPSSERAAEILINAAQRTDWVTVDDATDQRQQNRHERDSDEEDEQ